MSSNRRIRLSRSSRTGTLRRSSFAVAAMITTLSLTLSGLVIAAPANYHIALGQACADAELPFLTEKPLAVTMEGVDRLVATVARGGLPVRVGYVRRSSPETQFFREQLLGGRIGKLRMCYINCSQEFPKYRPDFQTTYYAKQAMGGGCILDAASHMFDLLMWVLGPVGQVSGMYDRLALPGVEAEDCALIALRFRSGAMANIAMNQFQKPNVCNIEMVGEKGNLLFNATGEILLATDDSGRWERLYQLAGGSPMELHEKRFAMQANTFMDIVDGKDGPLTTLTEARANLQVALAAKESWDTQRIITL